ncbi:MAG: DUF421 domain-containing protein [Bacteroidetes bacterium]|nr:DUF421 domain-containing protein [Bacteroidota bacterium]
MEWLTTSWMALGMVLMTTLGIYGSVVVLTRLGGLRSFSKMSSFDFAVTVAIGSVIASTVVAKDPPLLQGAMALAALYAVQLGVAALRARSTTVQRLVDNEPLLLMAGTRILHDNLRRAQVTEADLRAKLREANVIDLEQVRAVVQETTGDVSVLHAAPDAPPLDPWLLDGVTDSADLFDDQS